MAHLDAEVLAEFRAGLIAGRRGAKITAHLAGCDRCTALGHQLAGVSALLASVPLPALPASLAQRLDTVLAAEAARPGQVGTDQVKTDQAERGHAERPDPPATGRRQRPRPSFRLVSLRVLAPVAVVVLAAGGYGLSRIAGAGGPVTASSGSSAERAAGNAAEPSAASSHANGPKSPAVRTGAGSVPQAHRLTFTLVPGTVNFSADQATLKQQVEHELGPAQPAGTPGASGAGPPVTAKLRACVQNLTRGAPLVRVESGRFGGKPATLVVARTGPDDTAWVAGPDCSATSRDVLATTTVPAGTSEP